MREAWQGSTVVGAGGGRPGDGAGVAEETEKLRCRDGLGTLGTPEEARKRAGLLWGALLLDVGVPVFPDCILSFHRAS